MGKKKRGLAIIYDPHSLQQFLWYYYTYAKEVEWDALCLPNGYKGTYMTDYCDRAEIFKIIYSGHIDYLTMNFLEKMKIFSEMCFFYFIGRKEQFAKNVFNNYVTDVDKYDEIISICDTGFVSGLSTLFARTKKISFFDDGIGEYGVRSFWSSHFKTTSMEYWQGFIMMAMGYGCKGRFHFSPTKDCYKYSNLTSEMKYRNYKEMLDIDMSNTDSIGYNATIRKIYPDLDIIDFDNISAVFFTDDMYLFSSNYQEYYDKCTAYIGNRYGSVLLKKHPRDFSTYVFSDQVKVFVVDNSIPAEVLLPYLTGKKIFFAMFSSIILSMRLFNCECSVFYSSKFYLESKNQSAGSLKFHSRDELMGHCERFAKGRYQIIDLD